ncbi:MAG: radical SAM protein [Vicinamibacterales bacterium]
MRVHLVNPNDVAFGVGVIVPRWLYVLAGATPRRYGDPVIVDETLQMFDPLTVAPGDIVGIGIHTANALRGYEVGRLARERGAKVVFGGIHATLFPGEPVEMGAADSVVRGDGDLIWAAVLDDFASATPRPLYDGGRVQGTEFSRARWDLLPARGYMWGSVQTIRGCPKHCSFCSVWRTDGQKLRLYPVDNVVSEVVELRRKGFRFIALADDNFYPVTLSDLEAAARRKDPSRLDHLTALRQQRFELMERLSELPSELIFFTQITMEAAEDPAFLDAMRRAHIKGALVGVESVTQAGLQHIYKEFNPTGEGLIERLQAFRKADIHVLGSFIFGLPSDTAETFEMTADLANRAGLTFAQFVPLTKFPGTLDFDAWKASVGDAVEKVDGVPLTRYWLVKGHRRPKVYAEHPTMSVEEIRLNTQRVWDSFYSLRQVWERSRCVKALRNRLAFVLISRLYRQMYARTGIATDSARQGRAAASARILGRAARRLFLTRPMPDLQVPGSTAVARSS